VGTEEGCTKSKFSEGGRLSGSIVGGAAGGGVAAYITCNVIFGLPSGGTSMLWCGIVAGGAGGYFGATYSGDFMQSRGELLYENYYR
jgi:hypothetical protein